MGRGLASLVLASVLLVAGCEFRVEKGPREAFRQGSALGFAEVRDLVFAPRCVRCHGASAGVSVETYPAVRASLARIERAVLVDRRMPNDGPLASDQLEALRSWIDQGAREFAGGAPPSPTPSPTASPMPLPSPSPFPPLTPTFTSIRTHIFERKCMGCHAAEPTVTKAPLLPYAALLGSIRELVLPGNPDESGLVLAVEAEGDKRMPPPQPGVPPLPSDEIAAIREWIAQGALND